jgi:hypothetical protein
MCCQRVFVVFYPQHDLPWYPLSTICFHIFPSPAHNIRCVCPMSDNTLISILSPHLGHYYVLQCLIIFLFALIRCMTTKRYLPFIYFISSKSLSSIVSHAQISFSPSSCFLLLLPIPFSINVQHIVPSILPGNCYVRRAKSVYVHIWFYCRHAHDKIQIHMSHSIFNLREFSIYRTRRIHQSNTERILSTTDDDQRKSREMDDNPWTWTWTWTQA